MRDVECTNSTKMNVLGSINYNSAAWNEIKPNVIRNCFQKGRLCVWNDLKQIDNLPLEDFQSS